MKTTLVKVLLPALVTAPLMLAFSAPVDAGRFDYANRWGYQAAGVYSPYYGSGYAVDNFGGIGVWRNPVVPTWGFPQLYAPPVSGYNPGALPGYWNNGYFIPGW